MFVFEEVGVLASMFQIAAPNYQSSYLIVIARSRTSTKSIQSLSGHVAFTYATLGELDENLKHDERQRPITPRNMF